MGERLTCNQEDRVQVPPCPPIWVVEDMLRILQNPLYNSLEVGFRHTPLRSGEALQRYTHVIEDLLQYLEYLRQ